MFEAPKCDPEDDEVVDHVEECVDQNVDLANNPG